MNVALLPIANHSEFHKLKYVTYLRNVRDEYQEDERTYVALEHIESAMGKLIQGFHTEQAVPTGETNRFEQDDVLFGKLRPYLAKVFKASFPGRASTEFFILNGGKAVQPQFLAYSLLSKSFLDQVNGSTFGAKMPRASWTNTGQIKLWIPSQQVQQQIVDYLDQKTGQIDALIAKKRELLEKLKEKRMAVITQAVTKGPDPNAPMRDSGIPWLGQVPKHWEVRRLKFHSNVPLKYGANEAADASDPTQTRYVRITDIRENGTLREDTFRSLDEKVAMPYQLNAGDLLLARSGATVGKTFIYQESWGKAAYAGYLIRLRPSQTISHPDFLYLFAQSHAYWASIHSELIQSTIQNFSAEKYGSIRVPTPPPQEQAKIMANLRNEQARIGEIELATERAIQLLLEYRVALITEMTTGGRSAA